MESTEEENIVPQTSVSTPTVKPHQYIKASMFLVLFLLLLI